MADALISLIEQHGYGAVALLMLLENVFPPIPSELIMPFSGAAAARGDLSVVGVVLAGSIGSLAGALLWYWVGRRIGPERLKRWAGRHGRWLTLSPKDVDQADAWFDRSGHWAVLAGRLVPAVRTLISVPAGLSEMPLPKFLLWSGIGTVAWTSGLAALGFAMGSNFDAATKWIDWVSYGVLGLALAIYVWRVVRFDAEGGK